MLSACKVSVYKRRLLSAQVLVSVCELRLESYVLEPASVACACSNWGKGSLLIPKLTIFGVIAKFLKIAFK